MCYIRTLLLCEKEYDPSVPLFPNRTNQHQKTEDEESNGITLG